MRREHRIHPAIGIARLGNSNSVDGQGHPLISGVNQALAVGGTFFGKPVKPGDLVTDEAGRLVVLGGYGNSFSVPDNQPLAYFAENAGWCGDTSDSPVTATIRFAVMVQYPDRSLA